MTAVVLPAFQPSLQAIAAAGPIARFVPSDSRGLPVGGADPTAGAHRTATDFEAFFVTSMLESMSAGIKTDKMFGGGAGETMYRSMLNQEIGKSVARRGSFGISESIERQILDLQKRARS